MGGKSVETLGSKIQFLKVLDTFSPFLHKTSIEIKAPFPKVSQLVLSPIVVSENKCGYTILALFSLGKMSGNMRKSRFQRHNFLRRQGALWKVSLVCKQKQHVHALHRQNLLKMLQPLINLIKLPVCNKFT